MFCEGLSAAELMERVRRGNMYVSRFCMGAFEIFCSGNRYLPGDELQFEEDTVSVEYHIRVYDTTERICLYMIRDGRREIRFRLSIIFVCMTQRNAFAYI